MGMRRGGKTADDETEPVNKTPKDADLLAFRAVVHPDGADASIIIHTSDGAIRLSAQFEQVAALQEEIRSAALLMQYRQAMHVDQGENALSEILRTAPRPADSAIVVDAATGDRAFLLQFTDRLPIAFRMTPEGLNDLLGQISVESRQAAN